MARATVISAAVVVAVLVAAAAIGGMMLAPFFAAEDRVRQAPAVTTGDTTRDYLLGPGARLLEIHRTASGLVDTGDDAARCRESALRLDTVAQPDEATELVAGVPDEPLRAYLFDELEALEDALVRCAADEPPSVSGLEVAARSVDARLEQGGWPR